MKAQAYRITVEGPTGQPLTLEDRTRAVRAYVDVYRLTYPDRYAAVLQRTRQDNSADAQKVGAPT